jgi:hypothetical protein
MIDFMVLNGLLMVYPNFENQTSFSTNHYEEGVHSVPDTHTFTVPDKLRFVVDERFTVPLFPVAEESSLWQLLEQAGKAWRDKQHTHDECSLFPTVSLFHKAISCKDLDALKEKYNKLVRHISLD